MTDGTVTKILEAQFWEPITVDKWLHAEEQSSTAIPDLGIAAGDGIIKRRVGLRGQRSRTVYVAAETVVATQRFSPSFRQVLKESGRGIGDLIREHRLETFRDIVRVEQIEAGAWADILSVSPENPVWIREYYVYHQGHPSVGITEVFVEDRFRDG